MLAVQPVVALRRQVGIGGRAGDAIAVAEPVQKVAVAAALRAERLVRRARGLAAQGAGLSLGGSGHGRPIWRGRARQARPRRRRSGAPAAASQSGRDSSAAITLGAAWIATAPRSRPARRSKARAAAPTGSARSSSASEGRARRRTIWRKPKPLTAVRSNGCGRIASTARAAACRPSRGKVGRSMPIEPAMPKRRIARAAAAAPACARAAGGRPPSTSNRVMAGVRLIRSAPPSKAISPVAASSSSSDQPACSNRSGPEAGSGAGLPIRSSRLGPARNGRSVGARLGRLGPARLGDGLAQDLGAEGGALGQAGRGDDRFACRPRAWRCRRYWSAAPRRRRRRASPAARSRPRGSRPSSTRIARSSPIPSS